MRNPFVNTAAAYSVTAHNYAFDSDNKIHSDDVAAKYGFKGGLVPGVADIAYLARLVYNVWGEPWMSGGTLEAKLIKPVYHGDTASAQAITTENDNELRLELHDPDGTVCAAGRAGLGDAGVAPQIDDYPRVECGATEDRPAPEVATFPAGTMLGAYEYPYVADEARADAAAKFVDAWPHPHGSTGWHPATCLNDANRILRANVALGPWIHTASRLSLYGAPADGELVSLRGQVLDTYEKRGHVMTDADLAVFAGDRPIAHIVHTAIIRLAR
jgi:hypothetical protein